MENYSLEQNEVILYKGVIQYKQQENNTQLILTNLNIVVINKNLTEHSKIETIIETYPVNEIKMYQGVPQIKSNGTHVEIYLLNNELEFIFNSKIEQHKFISEATKLATGKTSAERSATKVKNAINLINDTFNTDIVKNTGNLISNTLNPLKKFGKKK